jgi:hypothetical protein
MKEHEWRSCTDPTQMVAYLATRVGDRKLRLFACHCCRRIWHLIEDERSKKAVEISERYADRSISDSELTLVRGAAWAASRDARDGGNAAVFQASLAAAEVAWSVAVWKHQQTGHLHAASMTAAAVIKAMGWEGESSGRNLARLIRDIFGNPFRPVSFDAEWRSSTVMQLANHIYEARDFAQMPILADALQDAGCNNADILSHCRDPQQVHVRGCWVVDGVLGKS